MRLPRGWRRLDASFFETDTVSLAHALLGTVLVHRTPDGIAAGRIVETEAYLSRDDAASHSFRGPTRRNASMFARAGTAYVYFVYGMHCCFNVVSARVSRGEAVLVRALEPLIGLAHMRARRGVDDDRDLCRGPGNLVRALGITLADDGSHLARGRLGVYAIGESALAASEIVAGPRVGISRARELPLRFHVRGSPWVSRVPGTKRATRGRDATGRVQKSRTAAP